MVTVFPKVINSPYPRTRLPLFLYSISISMALFLFYWSGLYCTYNPCKEDFQEVYKPKHILQYFPIIAAPTIMFISSSWLITAFFYSSSPCTLTYNFMEMPSAVFCSLLGGISAVIELHFSVSAVQIDWSDQWVWSAAVSIALCLLHAMVAFALQ